MEHITRNNPDEEVKKIQVVGNKTFFCNENSQPITYVVDAGAELTLVDVVTSGKRISSLTGVDLSGAGARVVIYGLFLGKEEDIFSIEHTVRHLAPHTTSNIYVRGVLDGSARATYNGEIKIAEGMGGCSGHEEIHTLLVSENSHMDAVPNLDIGNNDVQCSHAVTIATVDELRKFYLESRGLSEAEAVDVVVRGHVMGLVESIKDEDIKSKLCKDIESIL